MADLQKMSGGAGHLTKQAGKPTAKERRSVSRDGMRDRDLEHLIMCFCVRLPLAPPQMSE